MKQILERYINLEIVHSKQCFRWLDWGFFAWENVCLGSSVTRDRAPIGMRPYWAAGLEVL